MSALQTLIAGAAIVWIFSRSQKESVEEPTTTLPWSSVVNVTRWGGLPYQPIEDSQGRVGIGNLHPSVPWEGVDGIISQVRMNS